MSRVMIDLNDDFDNNVVFERMPSLIPDPNLRGGHTDNEQTFASMRSTIQGEMGAMKQKGTKEDPAETIKRTVMANIGNIKFDPKMNIVSPTDGKPRDIFSAVFAPDAELDNRVNYGMSQVKPLNIFNPKYGSRPLS